MHSDLAELKANVKSWERQFELTIGRKPTSADAKADQDVWRLYQQYRALKKSLQKSPNTKRSPAKQRTRASKSPSKASPRDSARKDSSEGLSNEVNTKLDASETDDDENTPSKQKITEIFPTPQFKGRPLGLFDLDLELPITPTKHNRNRTASPQAGSNRTPEQLTIDETPQSKRTPDYFLHRVDLFPMDLGESPLVRQKRRGKSVCEFMKEREEKDLDTEMEKEIEEQLQGIEMDFNGSAEHETEAKTSTATPSLPVRPSKRRNPKRQTRRVILRPVNAADQVSNAKPTENYVRLKIHKPKRK